MSHNIRNFDYAKDHAALVAAVKAGRIKALVEEDA